MPADTRDRVEAVFGRTPVHSAALSRLPAVPMIAFRNFALRRGERLLLSDVGLQLEIDGSR